MITVSEGQNSPVGKVYQFAPIYLAKVKKLACGKCAPKKSTKKKAKKKAKK